MATRLKIVDCYPTGRFSSRQIIEECFQEKEKAEYEEKITGF